MSDPERIFLEAECCVDPDYGRQWNSRDIGPNEDCDNESPWVEYVRADLVDPDALGQVKAENAELAESVDDLGETAYKRLSKLRDAEAHTEQLEAEIVVLREGLCNIAKVAIKELNSTFEHMAVDTLRDANALRSPGHEHD